MGGNISHIFQLLPILTPPPFDLSNRTATSSDETPKDPPPNPAVSSFNPAVPRHRQFSAPPPRPASYFQQPAQSFPIQSVMALSQPSNQQRQQSSSNPIHHHSNLPINPSMPFHHPAQSFPGLASIDSLKSFQRDQFPPADPLRFQPALPPPHQIGLSQWPGPSFLNPNVVDPLQYSQQLHLQALLAGAQHYHRRAQYFPNANVPPHQLQPSFPQKVMPRQRQLPTPPTHSLQQKAVVSCSQAVSTLLTFTS